MATDVDALLGLLRRASFSLPVERGLLEYSPAYGWTLTTWRGGEVRRLPLPGLRAALLELGETEALRALDRGLGTLPADPLEV